MIKEPSVLDYVKSIFKDWKSFFSFFRVLFSARQSQEINYVVENIYPTAEPTPVIVAAGVKRFPWRSLVALGLSLLGQLMLEPPGRRVEVGVAFYLLAGGMAIWACLRGEWNLASLPLGVSRSEPMTVRYVPLGLAVFFAALAFMDFGGNLFTWHNILLWLIATGFLVYAFWLYQPRQPLQSAINTCTKQKNLLWWGLVLAVIMIAVFFRFYRLSEVPLEPSSDHAEKIMDVYEITQGQARIFFPRNSGRECLQMYLTLVVDCIFKTGLSFLSLKIGTVLCGLAVLPYIYLLGKEIGSKRVGLIAMIFVGIAYWPNVISRAGLRFPFYPLFTAAVLYHFLRGLRTSRRNDFIFVGLYLGLGLHGYSAFRVVPVLMVILFVLYLLHFRSKIVLHKTVFWVLIVILVALVIFLPMLRYIMDSPESIFYRSLTRLTDIERPLPGPAWRIFLSNLWNALGMFNWDDGEVWAHSVIHRPALDVVCAAFFAIGVLLVFIRYLQKRNWQDLMLLMLIPLLELPSIFSLAFPAENPDLYRAGGAYVPAFLIVALTIDGLLTSIQSSIHRRFGTIIGWLVITMLLLWSSVQNFNLVFTQFDISYRQSSWNSSEMGQIIIDFRKIYETSDSIWIVPYPYWVDTRLPGIWAGIPNRDFAIWPDDLEQSLEVPLPKLFIINTEDTTTISTLRNLYPLGVLSRYASQTINHDFFTYLVTSE